MRGSVRCNSPAFSGQSDLPPASLRRDGRAGSVPARPSRLGQGEAGRESRYKDRREIGCQGTGKAEAQAGRQTEPKPDAKTDAKPAAKSESKPTETKPADKKAAQPAPAEPDADESDARDAARGAASAGDPFVHGRVAGRRRVDPGGTVRKEQLRSMIQQAMDDKNIPAKTCTIDLTNDRRNAEVSDKWTMTFYARRRREGGRYSRASEGDSERPFRQRSPSSRTFRASTTWARPWRATPVFGPASPWF